MKTINEVMGSFHELTIKLNRRNENSILHVHIYYTYHTYILCTHAYQSDASTGIIYKHRKLRFDFDDAIFITYTGLTGINLHFLSSQTETRIFQMPSLKKEKTT